MKAELSSKSKYHISKHRYYELLHFCRQYTDFHKEKRKLYDKFVRPVTYDGCEVDYKCRADYTSSRTEDFAIKLANIDDKIRMIERCCQEADEPLSAYLLLAVTGGLSYDSLKARYDIPCGREMFYDRYRKFFWLLDKER